MFNRLTVKDIDRIFDCNGNSIMNKKINIDEIIELAWCDKTSFDNIKQQTNLSEHEVIEIMRTHLKPSIFSWNF